MILALLSLIIFLAFTMPELIGVAIIALAVVWFFRRYRLEYSKPRNRFRK